MDKVPGPGAGPERLWPTQHSLGTPSPRKEEKGLASAHSHPDCRDCALPGQAAHSSGWFLKGPPRACEMVFPGLLVWLVRRGATAAPPLHGLLGVPIK